MNAGLVALLANGILLLVNFGILGETIRRYRRHPPGHPHRAAWDLIPWSVAVSTISIGFTVWAHL